MKFEDIVLKDAPTTINFWTTYAVESLRWEVYEPAETIEQEAPIGNRWWVLLYWMPKIKKSLYLLLLEKGLMEVEHRLFVELAIDMEYFYKHYGFFMKRLKTMKKLHKASPHTGETI